MNIQEALELAIEREKGAHRYYSEAASKSTSAESRKMFAWLASEEMGHLRILQRQSDETKLNCGVVACTKDSGAMFSSSMIPL